MPTRVTAFALVLSQFHASGTVNDGATDASTAALDKDDECGTGEEQCALNALQRKSMSASAAQQGLALHGSLVNGSRDRNTSRDGVEYINPDDMELGLGPVRHYSLPCWDMCGGKSGFCPNYCGDGNACCRYPGGGDQPPECGGSYVRWWPVMTWYTCVASHLDDADGGSATPAPAPIPIIGTNIMTMYQLTSPTAAKSIIGTNFRPGSGGWCGGAIYLINTPHLPKSKYNPETTQEGAYVEAQVEMGRMCRMQRTCNDGASGKCCTYPLTGGHGYAGAQAAGCNSMIWNPGDGDEYIVWHPEQVKSRKLYSCTKPECASLFPELTFNSDGVVVGTASTSNSGSPPSPATALPPAPPPPTWWNSIKHWAGWTPAPPPMTS